MYTILLAKTAKDILQNLRVMYKLLQWERKKEDLVTELKGLQVRLKDGYDEDSRIHLTMLIQKLEYFKDAFDSKVQNAIEELNKTLSADKKCKRHQDTKETLAVIISNIEIEQDFEKLFDFISK